MSQWTHVAGIIRVDCYFGNPTVADIKGVLGQIAKWGDHSLEDCDKHPERYTPTGSEGGIEYSILQNPDYSFVGKYTVVIWGDLRDYSDHKAIKEWFEKVIYDEKLFIRDAVLSIDVEFYKKFIVKYNERKVKK